jgi:DNA-binding transcriptional LysR family regulator
LRRAQRAREERGVTAPRDAGERLERLRAVLDAVDAALDEGGKPGSGLHTVRLNVPLEMSLGLVPRVVAEVRRAHPDTIFEVHGERRRAALIEEDFDLAVRVGALEPTSLIAADLGPIPRVLVVPGQVRPTTLEDLAAWPAMEVMGAAWPWRGRVAGEPRELAPSIAARVATFTAAAALAAEGVGATVAPTYAVRDALARGDLQAVGWFELEPATAHALYPRRHRTQPVVQALIAGLRRGLR